MKPWRDKLKRLFCVRAAMMFILAVGFLLRLPGLDRDLWFDEAISFFNARGADVATKIIPNGPEFTSDVVAQAGGWHESLVAVSHSERTPPLYFLLLRIWMELFGEGNQALRLLSVILGVVTILAVFLLGRTMFNEPVGLAAASMLAILPSHIQHSQEPRAYALATLLVTAASWVFWSASQAMGQRNEWRYWLLYVPLVTASLHTHYFTVGAFVAHGLFALVQPRSLRSRLVKRLTIAAAMTLLLSLPWHLSPYFKEQQRLFSYLSQIHPPRSGFQMIEKLKFVAALICYLVAGWLPGLKFKSLLGLILLGLYSVSAVTALSLIRQRHHQPAILFSFLLLAMPILLVVVVAAVFDDFGLLMFPRFVLHALPGLCLLFGIAITSPRQRAVSYVIALTVVALCLHFQVQWRRVNASSTPLPGVWWFYGNVSSAVQRVNQEAKQNELILFDDMNLPVMWNVYQKAPLPQLLMGERSFYLNSTVDFNSRWREVAARYAGVFVVRRAGEPPSEVVQHLERGYRLLSNERAGRLEIRHYIKLSAAGSPSDEYK